ncbi:MAG TPA: class I SAM-dependent methyltransferase [Thermoanaerobaculia bacterium]|nr:class I SAM-dependent methyltransferase [Thermoanaerobaculia bacterium]
MKPYDRHYFQRYYREPATLIDTPADLARRLRMLVGVAEALLARPVERVLDVGCGEGRWRAPLRRLRPGVFYLGIDPSDWTVRRFGSRRNIRRGSFGNPGLTSRDGRFDLVICSDVLHYVPAAEMDEGLEILLPRMRGIAYFDVSTVEDRPEGDLDGWHPRRARWYRERLRRAGLIECGLQIWASPPLASRLSALESR